MKRKRNRKSRATRNAELELAAELAREQMEALQALDNTMRVIDEGAAIDFPKSEEGGEA